MAASVVVPGPLHEICKLLFHKDVLKNLERSMLVFSLPLSELVTQAWLQTNTPLNQACLGALTQSMGMSIPAVPGVWLPSARAELTAWCSVQLFGFKLPLSLLKEMPGLCCLPETRAERSDSCSREEKPQ